MAGGGVKSEVEGANAEKLRWASGAHLNLSSLQREGYATQIVIIIMIMFHRMHLQDSNIQTLSYDIISSRGARKKRRSKHKHVTECIYRKVTLIHFPII